MDRTGDEIHTMMHLGPTLTKDKMKEAKWLAAYEDWNVQVGIDTGVHSVGQIGKGIWTMPDLMKSMYLTKINHPQAAANTAWAPSPTLAVLHALHYHEINVLHLQRTYHTRERIQLKDLMEPPLLEGRIVACRNSK